jgi:SAM-dependent methyltransferase
MNEDLNPDPITFDAVAATMRRYSAIYRYRRPKYQTAMLRSLSDIWSGRHERLLDVGGGTGIMAQCLADHFPVDNVTTIDIEDRFHPSLSVNHKVYDGSIIPFPDKSFDAAIMNNVIHHVPRLGRVALLREIARVSTGPLYIKDHLSLGPLDDIRLGALDLIGNVPFGGMVQAEYLTSEDWRRLATESGFDIREIRSGDYRTGLFAVAFPNRLETVMRWEAN